MSAALVQSPSDGADLVGTDRRIAGFGPVYEVVGTAGSGKVRIGLVEGNETVDDPVVDVLADPED